ncbi:MAG: FKBP-type peptidyl-prolyl cis-trans isomerase [Bacteroidetes bacterium]|nr:FKBP-type peptidyl-prolyl cis-trans isomerase [Bacteroidota bacterium]
MRKILILFLSVTLILSSCSKNSCSFQNDNIVAPVSEQQLVKAYLDSVGITATLNPSGFYYQVITPGTGATPGVCSHIDVTYTGKLPNGNVFDQQTNVFFTLGSLIEGWKKGVPLVKSGGQIKLYLPPTLGYGSSEVNTGTTVIPPNSILLFNISLLNVQ